MIGPDLINALTITGGANRYSDRGVILPNILSKTGSDNRKKVKNEIRNSSKILQLKGKC